MKPLMNLINAVIGTTMCPCLLDHHLQRLQRIFLDICIHQIILSLTEVRLLVYPLLLMHIRTMVPGIVVLLTHLLPPGHITTIRPLIVDHTYQGQPLIIR